MEYFYGLKMLYALAIALVGFLLFLQGIFVYLYFINIDSNYFSTLTENGSRSLKIFFNLSILLAGIGMSVIIFRLTNIINGNLGILIFTMICVIICLYCWYLLPGYIGNNINDKTRDIDLASSLVLFITGLIVGRYLFEIFIRLPQTLIPIFLILFLQSIFAIITYYLGDRGRPIYLGIFITMAILSLFIVFINIGWLLLRNTRITESNVRFVNNNPESFNPIGSNNRSTRQITPLTR